MDFDLTMTAPGSQQCHHMFETSSVIPEELRARLAPYLNGQIEVSSREEWWEAFHGLLVGARLTRKQVALVAEGASVTLREGTAELMLLLRDLGVPLLVASAGISNIIEETLRRHGLLLENVTVRANTMVFGTDGKLRSFRESPPLHSRNKQGMAGRESEYFESHATRRCVLVVGDKPGDADVSHGVAPEEHCLKIGFFDHSREYPHPDLPPLPPLAIDTARRDRRYYRGVGGSYGNGEGSERYYQETLDLSLSSLTDLADAEVEAIPRQLKEKGRRTHGGEPPPQDRGLCLAAAKMLLAYGDSFDVVARDGHSMDLVTDVVRHLIGDWRDRRASSPLTRRG